MSVTTKYDAHQAVLSKTYGAQTELRREHAESRSRVAERNRSDNVVSGNDRLYEKSQTVPDSPERNQIYREMNRLLLAYAPWRLGVHRLFNHLQYPWVKGYKKHPILYTNFKYLDIDMAAQHAATRQ